MDNKYRENQLVKEFELQVSEALTPVNALKLSTRQLCLESRMKKLQEIASKNGINLELVEAAAIAIEVTQINKVIQMDEVWCIRKVGRIILYRFIHKFVKIY